jgi:hypothetical protein
MGPRHKEHGAGQQDARSRGDSGAAAATLPPDQIQRLRTSEEWLVGFSQCHRSADGKGTGK